MALEEGVMPKVASADQVASSPIAGFSGLFADTQKAFTGAQAELLGHWREAGEHWTAFAQAEARIGAEWLSKLSTLQTLPQAAEAIQKLAAEQASVASQDGKLLLEDCQKCMMLTANLMSGGWMPRANGGKSSSGVQ
jgi:hypothetical protein